MSDKTEDSSDPGRAEEAKEAPKKRHWRTRYWAKQEAKAEEVAWESLQKREEQTKDKWQLEREKYKKNPQEYIDHLIDEEESMRTTVRNSISPSLETTFLAESSKEAPIQKMQETIDEMSKVVKHIKPPKHLKLNADVVSPFSDTPKLLIHRSSSPFDYTGERGFNMMVILPEYIDTNMATVKYFTENGQDREKQFKAAAAHELGHIANYDMRPESIAVKKTNPMNQVREILADRMGAIIYGNPMEYAEESSRLRFRQNKKNDTSNAVYSRDYLSANKNAKMLSRWAEILAEQGATDAKGNVILEPDENGHPMPLRALDVLERSREFTRGYQQMAANFGQPSPAQRYIH